ncbi:MULTISPECIES: hypothetical protein [unclassified Oscillibacter]|uniref:hypothetical protein n=1 Tax=unclassified Oscillibacter TaxID=2629304 RepID=UPI0025EC6F27|nr:MULTISPECIES: hypothetical protein [unclassified Oscillibacter]
MERTEQYQLSRWQKSDRILMDDFNADNAKIDAALAANAAAILTEKAAREAAAAAEEAARKSGDAVEEAARRNADAAEESARKSADAALQSSIIATNPIARIMDVTTTASANQVNLTIGNIDWNPYAQVLFYADIKGFGALGITVNGWTEKIYISTPGGNTMTQEYLLYESSLSAEGTLFTGTIPCARSGFGINWSYVNYFGPGTQRMGQSYIANNSWVKPRAEYSTLNFTTNGLINAGSRFVMMGVKL